MVHYSRRKIEMFKLIRLLKWFNTVITTKIHEEIFKIFSAKPELALFHSEYTVFFL